MKSNFFTFVFILATSLLLGPTNPSHALTNKNKQLASELKKCEREVKKLSDFGHVEKAKKKVKSCQKISRDLAKIKKGQKEIKRQLASMKKPASKKLKAKLAKKKKKKSRSRPTEMPVESTPEFTGDQPTNSGAESSSETKAPAPFDEDSLVDRSIHQNSELGNTEAIPADAPVAREPSAEAASSIQTQ